MTQRGHNENAVRLAALAGDAQVALDKVARGEADAIDGWLAYGTALNEGRSLFPGDREFGEWLRSSNLLLGDNDKMERAAAMWAAGNRDQFEEARAAGKARTVRGIHDKWKQIEAEREREAREAERKAKEGAARAEAEAKRKEAEEQAKAADEARHAAAAAKTEEDRKVAEEKAAEAAEARAEAEKAAEEAEAAAAEAEKAPDEDPATAKLRREFRKLTAEAQEDDWIGLRLELAEAKAKATAQSDEITNLKAQIKELTSEEDTGRKIGNLQRRLSQSEGRSKEHQASAARLQRQVNAQKAEIDKLNKQLELQEIPL